MLTENLEHRIASADQLRSSRELAEYKALCFGMVPHDARSVLDLGSATGEDALALAECLGADCRVIGLELDEDLVEESRRRSRNVALDVHFVVGDCRALPFAASMFDVVRADGVFTGLSHLSLALAEVARVLRPAALLIVHDEIAELGALALRHGLTPVTVIEAPYAGRPIATSFFTKHEVRSNDPV
jgi:ubiquinone/menaquinone biosynthesis C-methylase UbiE